MVENSSSVDITLVNSKATSLNSTLGQTSVDQNSQLTVIWYLHLKIIDENNAPLENVNVTILNSSDIEKYNYLTPSNGLREWIRCIEYIQEDRDDNGVSEKNLETPHKIQLVKDGYHPKISETDMTVSKSETIVLNYNLDPSSPSGILPISTHNLTPQLNWSPSTDPENDLLTYHISIWEGETATLGKLIIDDNTTMLTYFNITTKLRYGPLGNNTYYLELLAVDEYGGVSVINDHNFYVVNHPPEIGSLSDKTVYAGEALWFNVTATDPDVDPIDILNFSEDSDKFSIDPDTGEVYWVTTEDDVGVYQVEFTVDDGNGGTASQVINITVKSLNILPVPDAGDDIVVEVNTTVVLNGSGSSDEDGFILGFEWVCTSHDIVFGNANSSTPSFIPTEVGNYTIQLRVMDDDFAWSSSWDVVYVTVTSVITPNNAPELKNGKVAPEVGTDKSNYTFSVEYYDADNDPPIGNGYVYVIIDGIAYILTPENANDTDYRNGTLYSITIDGYMLGVGNHTFRFKAYDGMDFATGDIGNHTELTINPYEPKPDEKDTDEQLGFNLFWLAVILIIIIVIVIIIVALILARRRKPREAYPGEEPYDEFEEEEYEEAWDEHPRARRGKRGKPPAPPKIDIEWDADEYPESEEELEEEEEEEWEEDEEDEDLEWDEEEEDEEAEWEE
jgi:hypothetical protein